jgi:hypothetical protein
VNLAAIWMYVGLLGCSVVSPVPQTREAVGLPFSHATINAWIAVRQTPSTSSFEGKILVKERFTGRYELVVERLGPSRRATTRQSGAVNAREGLATTTSIVVSHGESIDETFRVSLRVFSEGRLVAWDDWVN